MKTSKNEQWLESVRSEYAPPVLTRQEENRIQQQAKDRLQGNSWMNSKSLGWALACSVVGLMVFAGGLEYEALQKQKRLSTYSDVVWAVSVLKKPTIDVDEMEYLPESFQAIAHLDSILDNQD